MTFIIFIFIGFVKILIDIVNNLFDKVNYLF